MKKLILSIIIAGFAFTNAQAVCCKEDKNWYIQGTGSFGWHNQTKLKFNKTDLGKFRHNAHKHGYGGAIAVGHIMNCWRLELEASHRENSTKVIGYRSNTSLMANIFHDIPLSDCISVYLGAGAGASSVNAKNSFLKKKDRLDTVFAWQVMGGLSFALSDNLDLVTGYRLFATAKPVFVKTHFGKLKQSNIPFSHNVEVGLRFKF